MPAKRHLMAFCWQANDGPLIELLGSPHPPHQLKKEKENRCQSLPLSDKTFWICACAGYIQMHFRLLLIIEANAMNPDPTSLIWVHIVCNFGSQSVQADKRADIELKPNTLLLTFCINLMTPFVYSNTGFRQQKEKCGCRLTTVFIDQSIKMCHHL